MFQWVMVLVTLNTCASPGNWLRVTCSLSLTPTPEAPAGLQGFLPSSNFASHENLKCTIAKLYFRSVQKVRIKNINKIITYLLKKFIICKKSNRSKMHNALSAVSNIFLSCVHKFLKV